MSSALTPPLKSSILTLASRAPALVQVMAWSEPTAQLAPAAGAVTAMAGGVTVTAKRSLSSL